MSHTKVALIQRSCGYALRPTLTIEEIERIIKIVKQQNPDTYVIVDNCYGEFTDYCEPPAVGADLCMGSFIKNPGGTIATSGGYVAGKKELVEKAVSRMSAPGVGLDAGSVPGETLRLMYQGLYMAPATVGEALKSGRLIASVFSQLGYNVLPKPGVSTPWSFITAIEMKTKEAMISFCEAVQTHCPVGSYVQPVPGVTAGYGDEVIFADGTFIDGSTAEMSADGPIRPPYVVYCQGGFHVSQWMNVLDSWLSLEENV
jgi:cystathionine beta-lyase family protein involved in aluminum resistance